MWNQIVIWQCEVRMVENLRVARKKEKEKREEKKERRLYISIKQATCVCRWKCCRAFFWFFVVAFISPFLGLCVMLVCPSFPMALYHLLALYCLLQMGFGTLLLLLANSLDRGSNSGMRMIKICVQCVTQWEFEADWLMLWAVNPAAKG